LNPPAIACLDAQTAVRRCFGKDRADIEANDRLRTFFDLESAHEGILCRNIATIPQENNRRKDNFDDFSRAFNEGWLLYLGRQSLSDTTVRKGQRRICRRGGGMVAPPVGSGNRMQGNWCQGGISRFSTMPAACCHGPFV